VARSDTLGHANLTILGVERCGDIADRERRAFPADPNPACIGGVVLVALLAGSRLLDYYVNWLWFVRWVSGVCSARSC